MTHPIKKVLQLAEEYDITLEATDPRFNNQVTLIHMDGSVLHFCGAFLMSHHKDYIICFTEHHNVFVYHKEDLIKYWSAKCNNDKFDELE